MFELHALTMKRSNQRSRVGHVTEFPLALYILFFVIIFPLIDLAGLATGAAIVCLTTHQAASRAANQRRYSDSLDTMQQSATAFLKTGLASFAKLNPVGGYGGCGSNLYIDACNYQTNAIQIYGPNTPLPPPADTSTNVYECRVQTTSEVGPSFDLSFIPGFSSVPGLGEPAVISFSASRDAEYPTGLAASSPPPSAAGSVPPYNSSPTVPQTGPLAGPQGSGWNHPNIYDQIKAAGQTVVAQDVVIVQANNYNWTHSGIQVGPGQTLWIDLTSTGSWSNGSEPAVNADGYTNPNWRSNSAPLPSAAASMLVGEVSGNSPFAIGTTYQNYAPGQTGQLMLIMNDNYYNPATLVFGSGFADNTGAQMVRVILTQ